MDFQDYGCRVSLSVKPKAFFYTYEYDEQQIHIDFTFKYEYHRYNQDQESATERFVEFFRPTTSHNTSASVPVVGESPSLEDIRNTVNKAIPNILRAGSDARESFLGFACEEVREIFSTEPVDAISTIVSESRVPPRCKYLDVSIEVCSIKREYAPELKRKKKREDRPRCCICLEELRGVRFRQMQLQACSHVFHDDCLVEWLRTKRSRSCPLCRRLIPEGIQGVDPQSIIFHKARDLQYLLQQKKSPFWRLLQYLLQKKPSSPPKHYYFM